MESGADIQTSRLEEITPGGIAPAEREPGTRGLYIVGGRQGSERSAADHFLGKDWYDYKGGVLLHIDTMSGNTTPLLNYTSPPEACPPEDPAILFKSGSLVDNKLFLTTQTEVMVRRLPGLEQQDYVSLPSFNDVHHAIPTPEGNILVAVTGLDMVTEVTPDGKVIRERNVYELGKSPWGERFNKDTDYRRVRTTKPHLAHPNHLFYIGNEPWATRFEQKDAMSLNDPSRKINIGIEKIHDGDVYGDQVVFTSIDGKVIFADTKTLKVIRVVDLAEMNDPGDQLGWCRGVLLDGDKLWVGFSRIRGTTFRQNIAFLKNGFKNALGTRVDCYDLKENKRVARIDTESAGLNAVFGIYPAVDQPAS